MELEEMLSKANELFGVDLEVLNAKMSEQVVLTIFDQMVHASERLHDSSVTQTFAVADIDLEVMEDYKFTVPMYMNLINFAKSLGENCEAYAREKVKNRLELAKETMQRIKDMYERYEVPKQDNFKKSAMKTALTRVYECEAFLDDSLERLAGKEAKEKERKLGRTEPATPLVRTDATSRSHNTNGGKEVLCFEIDQQQYYKISDIADMFGTTKSALSQHLSTSVEEKERERLIKEGKEKSVVYNGKRSNVYSVSAFETILPKKHHEMIGTVLAKYSPKPASRDEYRLAGEERSIDTVIERRSEEEKGVRIGENGREEGERAEQPASQAQQVEDSKEVINYFVYRGKNYYTIPNAAKVLDVILGQIYSVMNTKPAKELSELEAQGKLKVFKKERGGALKAYREDFLLELIPEKLRKGIDVEKRLKKLDTAEYEGKYKAITLAESSVSVGGFKSQSQRQDVKDVGVDNGTGDVAAKVRTRLTRAPKIAKEEAERAIRTEGTNAPPVEQPETPEAFRSSLPENLKEILNAEGLEQTVEGAETLYFLAINGQRYFPVSELKKVYKDRKYDGQAVNTDSFSGSISQMRKTGMITNDSLLKVMILKGFQGRKGNTETYFVREDVVQNVLPKYITDDFRDLTKRWSMQQYPLEYIDTETLDSEIKEHGLDKTKDRTSKIKPLKEKRRRNGMGNHNGADNDTSRDRGTDAPLERRVGALDTHNPREDAADNGNRKDATRLESDDAFSEETKALPYFTICGAKYFKLKDVSNLELAQHVIQDFEERGVIRYVTSSGKPIKGGAGTFVTAVIHETYISQVMDEDMRQRYYSGFEKISKLEIPSESYVVTDRLKNPVTPKTALVDTLKNGYAPAPEIGSGLIKSGRDTLDISRNGDAGKIEVGVERANDADESATKPAQQLEEALERTVENEEGKLYFLGVQGRRYFPVLSIHAVFGGKKYEQVNITDPELYLKIIGKRTKKQMVPNDACLMISVISGPEDEQISEAQWFIDEAYVNEAALPNSVTITFKDAIKRYSLIAYPMDKINRESLAAEMSRYKIMDGELMPYDDELSQSLGSDMETIDAVCKKLEGEGKIRFNYDPTFGTDGPKLLHPKYWLRVSHALTTAEKITSS